MSGSRNLIRSGWTCGLATVLLCGLSPAAATAGFTFGWNYSDYGVAVGTGNFVAKAKGPCVVSLAVDDMGFSQLVVSYHTNDAKGTSTSYSTLVDPIAIDMAGGLFNNDPYSDVVVTSDNGNGLGCEVLLMLGKGDGTFAGGGRIQLSGQVGAVAVGDVNGDGKLDAVASPGYVLLGNGDGTFRAPISSSIAGESLAVGDVNGDGKPDVVAGEWGSMSVVLGNGDGTFRAPMSFPIPGVGASVSLADVNGDGKPDMVTAIRNQFDGFETPQETDVLLGNGDGTFRAAVNVGPAAAAVAVADFNHDGRPDIASVDGQSASVALGNGDGTFRAPLSVGPGGATLAVADFNGDGYPDLATRGVVYLNTRKW